MLKNWLNEKNLYTIVKNHNKPFKKVFTKAFDSCNAKGILIISDWGVHGKRVAPLMAASYLAAAESLGYNVETVMQKPKTMKDDAEKQVYEALHVLDSRSFVIMSLSNKLGCLNCAIGKSFRRFATEKKHNFISTTGLGDLETRDMYLITRAMDLDYEKLQLKADHIKKILDRGRTISIKTDAGTDFTASITGMKSISIDGNFKGGKKGGNVPVGEVYLPPVTGTVDGRIVIDGSMRHLTGTTIIETPITLEVRKSQIVKITGGYESRLLSANLRSARSQSKRPLNVMKIGEIGIGINPKIGIVGSMVLDEKAFNTAHIAIGSNYWFGGDIYTFLHLDQVMRNPTIYIDGVRLDY